MAAAARPMAAARNLFVKTKGPDSLMVQGDAAKVRRIVQNLVFNALKYTETGGLVLSWEANETRWWIIVEDTGPGLRAGPTSPIADSITVATDSARESEDGVSGPNHVLPAPPGGSLRSKPGTHPPGEGIGLSIVKRLCELLEASIELTSSAKSGTVFRVVLPRQY
jgi:signal transduction histidine kinase